jgi:hypothetical protein
LLLEVFQLLLVLVVQEVEQTQEETTVQTQLPLDLLLLEAEAEEQSLTVVLEMETLEALEAELVVARVSLIQEELEQQAKALGAATQVQDKGRTTFLEQVVVELVGLPRTDQYRTTQLRLMVDQGFHLQ